MGRAVPLRGEDYLGLSPYSQFRDSLAERGVALSGW